MATLRERRASEWAARKARWDDLHLCTGCGRSRDLQRNGKTLKRCAACLSRVRLTRSLVLTRGRVRAQSTVSGKSTPQIRAILKREHTAVMAAQFTRLQSQLAQRSLAATFYMAEINALDPPECDMEYRR